MKTYLLSLAIICSVNIASAALEMPDGGAALFCPDQKPIALDIYEGQSRGALPAVYSNAATAEAKAAEVIARLENLDPARAKTWQAWAMAFPGDFVFIQGSESPVTLACIQQTVLLHRKLSVLNPDRYQIYQSLWESLDPDQQSVLIVHAVVYRELEESGAQFDDSDVRDITQLLFSDTLKNLKLSDYVLILKTLGFVHYQSAGFNLLLKYGVEVQGNHVSAGVLSSSDNILRKYFALSCQGDKTLALGSITVSPDGYLKSFEASEELMSRPQCYPHFYDDRIGQFVGHTWLFGEHEVPLMIQGLTNQTQELKFDYAFHRFLHTKADAAKSEPLPTLYRFDEMFRLREIALGGTACRQPSGEIQFGADLHTKNTSVVLNANGSFETEIESCTIK